MLNKNRQEDREYVTAHPLPEQKSTIDVTNLSAYETQDLVDAVRKNGTLGIQTIWQMLQAENRHYRSSADYPNGKNPKVEAKILSLIAHDLASAVDFDGNPVRTKETQEELAQTIKVSETTELLIELEYWFDTNKRKKVKAEIATVSKSISVMERARTALIQSLTFVTLENADDETLHFLDEVIALSDELHEQSKKHDLLVKSKNHAEFKLVSEIVDLFYNLVQLQAIDYRNSEVYGNWIREICNILGWKFEEALALTIAKYHYRNYKQNGKNDFNSEYKLIGNVLNLADEHDTDKITFPDNKQLKKLYSSLEVMVQPEIKVPTRKRLTKFLKRKFDNQKSPENIIGRKPAVTLHMHLDKLDREYKKHKRQQLRQRKNSQKLQS